MNKYESACHHQIIFYKRGFSKKRKSPFVLERNKFFELTVI